MHSVTYTPRGQARAELRLCVYSIYVYVCVCAQRGRRVATSSSSMTILLQFRCLVLGAPQKKRSNYVEVDMTEDEAQQAGRPAKTVSMANKRPPFRLRLRLACFHISLCFLRFDISVFFCFAFCGFFLCAALVAPFVGRLVARATTEGKREREGIGSRIRFAEWVAILFGRRDKRNQRQSHV